MNIYTKKERKNRKKITKEERKNRKKITRYKYESTLVWENRNDDDTRYKMRELLNSLPGKIHVNKLLKYYLDRSAATRNILILLEEYFYDVYECNYLKLIRRLLYARESYFKQNGYVKFKENILRPFDKISKNLCDNNRWGALKFYFEYELHGYPKYLPYGGLYSLTRNNLISVDDIQYFFKEKLLYFKNNTYSHMFHKYANTCNIEEILKHTTHLSLCKYLCTPCEMNRHKNIAREKLLEIINRGNEYILRKHNYEHEYTKNIGNTYYVNLVKQIVEKMRLKINDNLHKNINRNGDVYFIHK